MRATDRDDRPGRRALWARGLPWACVIALLLGLRTHLPFLVPGVHKVYLMAAGSSTVAERVREFGPAARVRLAPHFREAAVGYPPHQLTLAYFKAERELQVYAGGPKGPQRFIRAYPSTAASGQLGPKLREGDLQVPEGFYKIVFLNPNSRFHLSLRVGYPNAFDRERGREDGRKNLGGDIMIHGSFVSIGCIAMGDEAAEDLFVLAADTGISRIAVLLSPVDFRVHSLPADFRPPTPWTMSLYERLRTAVTALPRAR